eukprot:CAMPEP_0194443784 /NCGR_PEP_ID=MMETSP0176-20130528/126900_1 /TAXON_ID=216777 /ORGANISM="Proboscia alata, Strain PI-D3" /LENGTH=1428 /DNA_ID=CAMNT_0039270079 /DNA_START=16 /DNA_END=4301 /DNA_ORIENTATION=-
MNMYQLDEPHLDDRETTARVSDTKQPIQTQLLVNYCFGHPQSSVLLYPYGSQIHGVNHADHTNLFQNANAKLQWADADPQTNSNFVTKNNFNHPEYLEGDVEHLSSTNSAVLALELVALRDLWPNEEILIDYGVDYQRAWEEHVEKWQRKRFTRKYTDYVSAVMMNNAVNTHTAQVRTRLEEIEYPYPDTVRTGCYHNTAKRRTLPIDATPEFFSNFQDEEIMHVWQDDTEEKFGTDQYLFPCLILDRNPSKLDRHRSGDDGEVYAALLAYEGTVNKPQEHNTYVVAEMPRSAIVFYDIPNNSNSSPDHWRRDVDSDGEVYAALMAYEGNRSQEHNTYVVAEMPRSAIVFYDMPSNENSSPDHWRRDAFRHSIGLPDGTFPDKWLNLPQETEEQWAERYFEEEEEEKEEEEFLLNDTSESITKHDEYNQDENHEENANDLNEKEEEDDMDDYDTYTVTDWLEEDDDDEHVLLQENDDADSHDASNWLEEDEFQDGDGDDEDENNNVLQESDADDYDYDRFEEGQVPHDENDEENADMLQENDVDNSDTSDQLESVKDDDEPNDDLLPESNDANDDDDTSDYSEEDDLEDDEENENVNADDYDADDRFDGMEEYDENEQEEDELVPENNVDDNDGAFDSFTDEIQDAVAGKEIANGLQDDWQAHEDIYIVERDRTEFLTAWTEAETLLDRFEFLSQAKPKLYADNTQLVTDPVAPETADTLLTRWQRFTNEVKVTPDVQETLSDLRHRLANDLTLQTTLEDSVRVLWERLNDATIFEGYNEEIFYGVFQRLTEICIRLFQRILDDAHEKYNGLLEAVTEAAAEVEEQNTRDMVRHEHENENANVPPTETIQDDEETLFALWHQISNDVRFQTDVEDVVLDVWHRFTNGSDATYTDAFQGYEVEIFWGLFQQVTDTFLELMKRLTKHTQTTDSVTAETKADSMPPAQEQTLPFLGDPPRDKDAPNDEMSNLWQQWLTTDVNMNVGLETDVKETVTDLWQRLTTGTTHTAFQGYEQEIFLGLFQQLTNHDAAAVADAVAVPSDSFTEVEDRLRDGEVHPVEDAEHSTTEEPKEVIADRIDCETGDSDTDTLDYLEAVEQEIFLGLFQQLTTHDAAAVADAVAVPSDSFTEVEDRLRDGEVHPVEDAEHSTTEEPKEVIADREDIGTHRQEKEISEKDDTSNVLQHETNEAFPEDEDETLLDLWQRLTKKVTIEEDEDETMIDLWQRLTNDTAFQGYDEETLMDLFIRLTNDDTDTLDYVEAVEVEEVANEEENYTDGLLREEDHTENDDDDDDASHIPQAEESNECDTYDSVGKERDGDEEVENIFDLLNKEKDEEEDFVSELSNRRGEGKKKRKVKRNVYSVVEEEDDSEGKEKEEEYIFDLLNMNIEQQEDEAELVEERDEMEDEEENFRDNSKKKKRKKAKRKLKRKL